MHKKGYGQIQEARKGDLEKSELFGGKELGQDQTLGARGGNLLSHCCAAPWKATGTSAGTGTGTGLNSLKGSSTAVLLSTPVSDGKLRLKG